MILFRCSQGRRKHTPRKQSPYRALARTQQTAPFGSRWLKPSPPMPRHRQHPELRVSSVLSPFLRRCPWENQTQSRDIDNAGKTGREAGASLFGKGSDVGPEAFLVAGRNGKFTAAGGGEGRRAVAGRQWLEASLQQAVDRRGRLAHPQPRCRLWQRQLRVST